MTDKTLKIVVLTFISSVLAFMLIGGGLLFWNTYKGISDCDAIQTGDTEELKAKIISGSIDIEKGCPFPILAHFSREGNPDMVKFLIENGAEVEKKFTYSSPHSTPYYVTHTALFSAIHFKYEKKQINFAYTIDSAFIQSLEILLQNGASLDTPCGRVYKEKATDSIIEVLRKESPDNQTARELITLIDDKSLNTLLEKY